MTDETPAKKSKLSLEEIAANIEMTGMVAVKELALSKNFSLDNVRNVELIDNIERQIQEAKKWILSAQHIKEKQFEIFFEECKGIISQWIGSGFEAHRLDLKIKYLTLFYEKFLNEAE